ncbi:MAG: type II toxin-antitoxin system Phd/YefM family antitoxin [Lachnospiraceae bacterium]|nr:type II toxin-antitoxin system Phd/YefM family antitoxin [Lachnospiraceae bacterium]
MNHITANKAQKDFYRILDGVITQGISISIATDDGAAILVNQDEWNGMLETIYLQSIPGMNDSIMEGKATPVSECLDSVGWDIN